MSNVITVPSTTTYLVTTMVNNQPVFTSETEGTYPGANPTANPIPMGIGYGLFVFLYN